MAPDSDHQDKRNRTQHSQEDASRRSRIIDVSELLGQDREVILLHAGQHYALRITSNNRLILTK